MKCCEQCGREYDESLDACPHCVKALMVNQALDVSTIGLSCLAVACFLVLWACPMAILIASCSKH